MNGRESGGEGEEEEEEREEIGGHRKGTNYNYLPVLKKKPFFCCDGRISIFI